MVLSADKTQGMTIKDDGFHGSIYRQRAGETPALLPSLLYRLSAAASADGLRGFFVFINDLLKDFGHFLR